MQTYIFERISLVLLMGVFFISMLWWHTDLADAWYVIIATTYLLGYTHYLIGSYYQVRGLQRFAKPMRARVWFLIFTILSVLFVCTMIYLDLAQWTVLSVITYFLLHGYFNEITLFRRTTGREPNLYLILSLKFFVAGIIILSIGHPSSFYGVDAQYAITDPFIVGLLFNGSLFQVFAYWFGIANIVIALLIQSWVVLQATAVKRLAYGAVWLGILTTLLTLDLWYPGYYIALWTGALLYHFLIWFMFYTREFKHRSIKSLRVFLLVHVLLLAPFSLLFFDFAISDWISFLAINGYTFFGLTMIHITTSFLNEPWLKRWLGLV